MILPLIFCRVIVLQHAAQIACIVLAWIGFYVKWFHKSDYETFIQPTITKKNYPFQLKKKKQKKTFILAICFRQVSNEWCMHFCMLNNLSNWLGNYINVLLECCTMGGMFFQNCLKPHKCALEGLFWWKLHF